MSISRIGFNAIYLALILLGGCDSEPTNKPSGLVVLPESELEALRTRVKRNLVKIEQLCQQNNISAGDIYAAFHAVDWDKSSEERLSRMPIAIRQTMMALQKDLETYGELIVSAYDEAEGRKLVEVQP